MNSKTEIIITCYGQIGWRGVIMRDKQEWYKVKEEKHGDQVDVC